MLALGNIKSKCEACKGIGWVSKVNDKEEDELLASAAVVDVPRKTRRARRERAA